MQKFHLFTLTIIYSTYKARARMSSRSSRDMFGCSFFDWLLLLIKWCHFYLSFSRAKWPLKVTWPNLDIFFTRNRINFWESLFYSSFVPIGLNRQNIDHPSTFWGKIGFSHALISLSSFVRFLVNNCLLWRANTIYSNFL